MIKEKIIRGGKVICGCCIFFIVFLLLLWFLDQFIDVTEDPFPGGSLHHIVTLILGTALDLSLNWNPY